MDGPCGSYSIEMWRAEDEGDVRASLLQREVWEELRVEPELETCLGALSVYVTGREVTLSGVVRWYPQKAVAWRAVCRVPGVVAIKNAIRVELVVTDRRTDEVIAEEVRQVLGWDTLVPADRIDVAVRDGCVTLRGAVDREHQRTAAEQAVEPLVGITGICNDITVRPMYASGNVQIPVLAAIRRLRARGVRVATHGGVIELHGRVASLAERDLIERTVREVPGVTSVADGLSIEP